MKHPRPHSVSRRHLLRTAAAIGGGLALGPLGRGHSKESDLMPDLILHHARITTLDPARSRAQAIAIREGRVQAVGSNDEILRLAKPGTLALDVGGRAVIPGLNDSHTHLIRGGLNFNMELRWEGVPSLADALRLLREQAARTPPPQWVRVVGGWSHHQFHERRMPTLEEINAAAPDTPVFILHLYAGALLNRAALAVLDIGVDTPDPPGGAIQRDRRGRPTGMLIAKPSALILYSTLARGPRLGFDDQVNSTRHYMREMNRLGITSVIDAGGGGQNYPDDYAVIEHLYRQDQLTVRIAYNLFAQRAGEERSDYERWVAMTRPGAGSAMLRMNGAGENLVWSAADFENFLEPRPDLAPVMERELESVVELLARERWPFRIHATYDESIDRFLGVFERVNARQPFATRFIVDHAETVSERNLERIMALGGGVAIQHRMAFQGESFVARYGAEAARRTPPVARMLSLGLPVGAGTDATRVASYDPWVALHWLTTGETVGGLKLYGDDNLLDRESALRLWTHGSAWFSGEAEEKGQLRSGAHADLAVLSADYMTVPAEEIRWIHSVLTVVAGRVVHGDGDFADLAPPLPPASPGWSPVASLPTPGSRTAVVAAAHHHHATCQHTHRDIAWNWPVGDAHGHALWGAYGCACFAF